MSPSFCLAQARLDRQRQREQEEQDCAAQAEEDAAVRVKEGKRRAATLFKERKFQEDRALKEALDRKDAARAKRAAAVKHREHTLMCVSPSFFFPPSFFRGLSLVPFFPFFFPWRTTSASPLTPTFCAELVDVVIEEVGGSGLPVSPPTSPFSGATRRSLLPSSFPLSDIPCPQAALRARTLARCGPGVGHCRARRAAASQPGGSHGPLPALAGARRRRRRLSSRQGRGVRRPSVAGQGDPGLVRRGTEPQSTGLHLDFIHLFT